MLTGLSVLWFDLTRDVVPNHLISATEGVPDEFRGRGLRVKRLEMLPVECVVRGYLSGSGWKDYQATGRVSGIELPPGLRESEQLPEPIFTPSTKAEEGHDEAIDFEQAGRAGRLARARGAAARRLARRVRPIAAHARERGVILADTKFEFGLDRTARSRSATRSARPTRRASGRPTGTSPAAASRASTSSTCATGRPARAGTRRRRRRRSPTTSSRRRASAT